MKNIERIRTMSEKDLAHLIGIWNGGGEEREEKYLLWLDDEFDGSDKPDKKDYTEELKKIHEEKALLNPHKYDEVLFNPEKPASEKNIQEKAPQNKNTNPNHASSEKGHDHFQGKKDGRGGAKRFEGKEGGGSRRYRYRGKGNRG